MKLGTIACTGYTVTWYQDFYFMTLVRNSGSSTTPTITCTGFQNGDTVGNTVTVSTEIIKSGTAPFNRFSIGTDTLATLPAFGTEVRTAERLPD